MNNLSISQKLAKMAPPQKEAILRITEDKLLDTLSTVMKNKGYLSADEVILAVAMPVHMSSSTSSMFDPVEHEKLTVRDCIDLLKIKHQEEQVIRIGGFTRARSAGEVAAIMQQMGKEDIYTPYRGHAPSRNNLSRKKVDI